MLRPLVYSLFLLGCVSTWLVLHLYFSLPAEVSLNVPRVFSVCFLFWSPAVLTTAPAATQTRLRGAER